MEEFEEIEKKAFSKKPEPKPKSVSNFLNAPGSASKKSKTKGPGATSVSAMEEELSPEFTSPPAEGKTVTFAFPSSSEEEVIQSPPLVKPKASPKPAVAKEGKQAQAKVAKQAEPASVTTEVAAPAQGPGSVIKLLLSSPAVPSATVAATNVIATPAPLPILATPIPAIPVVTSPPTPAEKTAKKPKAKPKPKAEKTETAAKQVKLKGEKGDMLVKQTKPDQMQALVKEELVSPSPSMIAQEDLPMTTPIKDEMMDVQASHMLLTSTLKGQNDPMLSSQPTLGLVKSEPISASGDNLSNLKMKLMMSPKDQNIDLPSAAPMMSLFGKSEEIPTSEMSAEKGKKKAAPKKKKPTEPKKSKAAADGKSAVEQLPNLAAMVSQPKVTQKQVKQESNMSLSDAMETSLSDASLDMSSIGKCVGFFFCFFFYCN